MSVATGEPTFWRVVLLAAAMVGCDTGDTRFTVQFASDFAATRRTVSVLGVFKDGRMSSSGWETLRPHLASALGAERCDVGYDALGANHEALADAIDGYTRANGPTDDLLTQIAPAAKGDLVLVLTYAGALPRRVASDGGPPPGAPTQGMGGGRGGGRGMRGAGTSRATSKPPSSIDTNVLDIAASLYSVAQSRSVASVAMQYSGVSLDEAMTSFAAKLAQSVPGMLCAGWNWDTQIDANRIRESIDE
ncbi:MAG: hypothetical protein ABSF69_07040 [Polyangiaceae bacterium]|jgi:hypothetical protein